MMQKKHASGLGPATQARNHDLGDEIVRVNNLSVGYDKEHLILEDVSFSVGKGEIVAILGHSGCGKSTLFKALIGLLRPTRGTITIGGKTLNPEC